MSLSILVLALMALALTITVVLQSFEIRRLKDHARHPSQPNVTQPTADELEARLKAAYQDQIQRSVATFGQDLTTTSKHLGEQVSRLTTQVIEEELDAYQKTLGEMRSVAAQAMDQIHAAVEEQRAGLRQNMEQDLAAERQRLADRFDTKLSEVVSSYVTQSLGAGVDLGAQMQFIISALEERKADIKRDILQ